MLEIHVSLVQTVLNFWTIVIMIQPFMNSTGDVDVHGSRGCRLLKTYFTAPILFKEMPMKTQTVPLANNYKTEIIKKRYSGVRCRYFHQVDDSVHLKRTFTIYKRNSCTDSAFKRNNQQVYNRTAMFQVHTTNTSPPTKNNKSMRIQTIQIDLRYLCCSSLQNWILRKVKSRFRADGELIDVLFRFMGG